MNTLKTFFLMLVLTGLLLLAGSFFGTEGVIIALVISLIIGLLVVVIVLPIVATLVRLAISRAREYQADATGAKTSGKPWALADALEKLEAGSRRRPMQVNEGVAHLFIVNPLSGESLINLLSTHPPIAERVKRLRNMRPVW